MNPLDKAKLINQNNKPKPSNPLMTANENAMRQFNFRKVDSTEIIPTRSVE